jgi:hypothetical protein
MSPDTSECTSVRADGAGPGDLAVAQHGAGVAGQPGMVHQQPRVVGGILGERLQHRCVQLGPAGGGQGVLDSTPQQLVPVRDPVAGRHQHPRVDAPVHRGRRAGHRGTRTGRHHGDQVGHVAGGRGQGPDAFQDQVLHRAGHRVRVGLEHLGDQQRVPAGQPVDRLGVAAGPVRLGEHALARECGDHHPGRDGGRHGAEDTAQRVVGAHLVVAVGHDEQCRQPFHPPGQEHQPVQGRLVGPVRVLDDHHLQPGRVRRQLVQERREELLLGRSGSKPLGQHTTGLPADVVQRAEGARRDQPVAAAPQHPGPVLDPTSELGDE